MYDCRIDPELNISVCFILVLDLKQFDIVKVHASQYFPQPVKRDL